MLNQNVSEAGSTEALIVGGGPAGLAAAIALRQRGIECVVVEARSPGIDKACGEGLMPDSREALGQLGIALTHADGHPFHGIRFANASHSVDALFPSGTGIGIRRPHLHTLLTTRAEAAGARILWNSHVHLPDPAPSEPKETGLPPKQRVARINGQPIRFRWLIGADGQSSTVRRWAGLERARMRSLRFGFRTHYRVAPWSRFVEVHWAPGGQLYITPVSPDCVCVVYITRDPHRIAAGARADILDDFPEVAARLAGAGIASTQRGAITASCTLHRVAAGSVALLGDASGSADAITGEGLAISFRQALALAGSIAEGSLAPYRRAHRRIARLPLAMGELMLTLDRWPSLQARSIRALAAAPVFFEDLLHAHMGEKSVASVLLRRAPRFGWNLLT